MESKTYRGHWWLPGAYENRVGGELEYGSDEFIRLKLFSALNEDPTYRGTGPILKYPKILGATTDGTPITVVSLQRDNISENWSDRGINISSEYVASYLIEGEIFENTNPALDFAKISFPYLEEWALLATPKVNYQTNSQGVVNPGNQVHITFTHPQSHTAQIGPLSITLGVEGTANWTLHKDASITSAAYLKIEPRRPQVPLSEYFEWISKLQNLVALATNRPVAPSRFDGRINGADVSVKYLTEGDKEASGNTHPMSFLFHFDYIRGSFSDVLEQWFDMSERMSPVLDLYFSTQFNQRMYVNNTFLSLSQALESYHRRTQPGNYHSEYKYELVFEDMKQFLYGNMGNVYNHSGSFKSSSGISNAGAMLRNLDEMYNLDNDFINKMKDGTLKYANEYSLAKRLNELVNDKKHILQNLPYNMTNDVRKIVNTRNYLTHYDEDIKARADDKELVVLSWGMEQLLEVCLLERIGIHQSIIESRLQYKYERKSVN